MAAGGSPATPWYQIGNHRIPSDHPVLPKVQQMLLVCIAYVALREIIRGALVRVEACAKLSPLDQRLFVARLTSNVHALATVGLSGAGMFQASWFPVYHSAEAFLTPNCLADTLAMVHSGGYFLSDWVELGLTYKETGFLDGGPAMFVHHLLGLLGYLTSIAYNRLGHLWCVFLFTELTTPFVNNLFFLSKLGLKQGRLMLYNGWTLFVLWLLLRVLLSWYLIWGLADSWYMLDGYPFLCKAQIVVSLAGACIMNYLWFARIVKGALKMVRSGMVLEDAAIDGADNTKEKAT